MKKPKGIMLRKLGQKLYDTSVIANFVDGSEWTKILDKIANTGYTYRMKKGFPELMAKIRKGGVKRIRLSKLHHMLNMRCVSRQSGLVDVDKELTLIAERKLHGHK